MRNALDVLLAEALHQEKSSCANFHLIVLLDILGILLYIRACRGHRQFSVFDAPGGDKLIGHLPHYA